jgi:hypothetical protein
MSFVWDRERFERLKTDLAKAEASRTDVFDFHEDDPNRKWRFESTPAKTVVIRFSRAAARAKIAELEPAFRRPEKPKMPYREGVEGQ